MSVKKANEESWIQECPECGKRIREPQGTRYMRDHLTKEHNWDWEEADSFDNAVLSESHNWENDESVYNEVFKLSHKVFANEVIQDCPNCNDGVQMNWEMGEGSPDYVEKCDNCNGSGRIKKTEIDCSKCDATGKGDYRGDMWGDHYPCEKCYGRSNITEEEPYGPETEEVRMWRQKGILTE